MRIFTTLALGLTCAASSLAAQSNMPQAPVPGPYMIFNQPQPVMPTFAPARFAMPYWMQNPPQQQARPAAPVQNQPAVGRANQQPAATGAGIGWTAPPVAQTHGQSPTPGFFPSYNSGQPQRRSQPQQPPANYGSAYQNNSFAPRPWGQYGGQNQGQQRFMPMPAPWQYGQNGWGNTWNNNGYGYPQGYSAPNQARQ